MFQNQFQEEMAARSNELAEVRKKLSEALGENAAAYFLHLRSLNTRVPDLVLGLNGYSNTLRTCEGR